MQGDKEIIALLNEQLTAELTAINQYFLHAKMQENRGCTSSPSTPANESIDEMQHAEKLTDRILFLEGLPNYQKLNRCGSARPCPSSSGATWQVEMEAVDRLRRGIELMRSRRATSPRRKIFEEILDDEEEHIDYLETQLDLMEEARRGALPGAVRLAAPGWRQRRLNHRHQLPSSGVSGALPDTGRAPDTQKMRDGGALRPSAGGPGRRRRGRSRRRPRLGGSPGAAPGGRGRPQARHARARPPISPARGPSSPSATTTMFVSTGATAAPASVSRWARPRARRWSSARRSR